MRMYLAINVIANVRAESSRPRFIIRSGCKTIIFVRTLELNSVQGQLINIIYSQRITYEAS